MNARTTRQIHTESDGLSKKNPKKTSSTKCEKADTNTASPCLMANVSKRIHPLDGVLSGSLRRGLLEHPVFSSVEGFCAFVQRSSPALQAQLHVQLRDTFSTRQ